MLTVNGIYGRTRGLGKRLCAEREGRVEVG